MGSFGWQELLIVLVILLLLFGAAKLPNLARSMGQSVRGFKKGMNEDDPEDAAHPTASSSDAKNTSSRS